MRIGSIKIKNVGLLSLLIVISLVGLMQALPEATAMAAAYEDETNEDAVEATGLVIDEDSLRLAVGDDIVLTVTVQPEDAVCPPLVWTSSDENVAAVDEDGRLTAVNAGNATVSVEGGGMADTCEVTVVPVPVYTIPMAAPEVTLAQHDTLALLAKGADVPESIVWSSGDESVALVDAAGNVTAVSRGVTDIFATDGMVRSVCTVTVVPSEILGGLYEANRVSGLLEGVPVNTTVDALKTALGNDADSIEVYSDDTAVESGLVGSGMDVKLVVAGVVKDKLGVCVVGDVNGDGLTTVYEYSMARMHLLGNPLPGTNLPLLDLNGDGCVGITDYVLIRFRILGINEGIDLGNLPDLVPSLNAAGQGCCVTLSWSAIPEATGYELQKAQSSSGPFQPVGSNDSSCLNQTDSTLAMESSYYYRVVGYRMVGDERIETQYSEVKKYSTPDYTTYYQGDSRWGFSKSVRKTGCVMTSFAITINNMGIPCTPPDVYKSNGKDTSIRYDGLKKNFGVKPVCGLGASSPYLSSFNGTQTFIKNPSSNLEAAVKEALSRNPEGVILYFKKGSDAHAVVACKLANGKIYYSDPGRNRSTLVDFSETWCKVGHNMSYKHLAYMIALDRV